MTCAKCDQPTSGKSKYCVTHKREARQAWVAMIKEKSSEREGRHAKFYAAWKEAVRLGHEAVKNLEVTPMIVEKHANPLDDNSPVVQSWFVEDGVCGFAWLKIKGNTSFAKWAKENANWRSDYGGGVSYWISEFRQSMQKKEAFAYAAAEYLRSLDIPVYAESRID